MISGTEEAAVRVGVSVCDIAAGMTSYQAIVQGLFARERTGKGRVIEVSLFHVMADWMNVPYLQSRYGVKKPARMGLKHPTIAPYGAYTCADGKAVLISIQNEREWAQFCADVLADAAIATDARFANNSMRVANRPALEAIIVPVFAALSRETIIERLNHGRIRRIDISRCRRMRVRSKCWHRGLSCVDKHLHPAPYLCWVRTKRTCALSLPQMPPQAGDLINDARSNLPLCAW